MRHGLSSLNAAQSLLNCLSSASTCPMNLLNERLLTRPAQLQHNLAGIVALDIKSALIRNKRDHNAAVSQRSDPRWFGRSAPKILQNPLPARYRQCAWRFGAVGIPPPGE